MAELFPNLEMGRTAARYQGVATADNPVPGPTPAPPRGTRLSSRIRRSREPRKVSVLDKRIRQTKQREGRKSKQRKNDSQRHCALLTAADLWLRR